MTSQMINKTMKIEEIILGFPQKAQKLRRMMRNVLPCAEDLPNEPLEVFLLNRGKKGVEIELFVKTLNDVLEEQTDPHRINFTEKAASKFKELFRTEGKTHWGLRMADQPAKCGTGFEYVLEISSSPSTEDQIFYSHGLEIYSPRESLKRFLGSVIDYEESPIDDHHFTGLLKDGFLISNPKVTRSK
jgi:Fe-S cluster assembly iron-binding protein IscA